MSSFKVYISEEEDCSSPSSLPSVSPPSSPSSPPFWLRGPLLGCGAYGSVSLAIDGSTGHLMAVKSVTANADGDRQSKELQALENEMQILQKVISPRVIECYGADWSEENGVRSRNLLLELASGGSLADLLKKFNKGDGLDEILVRRFTRGITEGLRDLHARGIVHCDVKGQNVLLCKSGVKLCDFGSSFQVDSAGSPGSSPRNPPQLLSFGHDEISARLEGDNLKDARARRNGFSGPTRSAKLAGTVERKQMKGTICWMAPEVVAEEGASPASDIWSLGCTVIEMLTGRPPWVSKEAVSQNRQNPKSFMSVLYRIGCSVEVPEFPEKISAQGRDFLTKCLDRDPERRLSAEELLQHPFIRVASGAGAGEVTQTDEMASISNSNIATMADDFNFFSSPGCTSFKNTGDEFVGARQEANCLITDSFNVQQQPSAAEPASGAIIRSGVSVEDPRPTFTMPPPLNLSFDFSSEPSVGLQTARGEGHSCFENLSCNNDSPNLMGDSPDSDATESVVDPAFFKLFDDAFASSFFSGTPSPHLLSPLHEVASALSAAGSFCSQSSPGSPAEPCFPPAASAPSSFRPAQTEPTAEPTAESAASTASLLQSSIFSAFHHMVSRQEPSSSNLHVRAFPSPLASVLSSLRTPVAWQWNVKIQPLVETLVVVPLAAAAALLMGNPAKFLYGDLLLPCLAISSLLGTFPICFLVGMLGFSMLLCTGANLLGTRVEAFLGLQKL